jgi:hypothetical protein
MNGYNEQLPPMFTLTAWPEAPSGKFKQPLLYVWFDVMLTVRTASAPSVKPVHVADATAGRYPIAKAAEPHGTSIEVVAGFPLTGITGAGVIVCAESPYTACRTA